MPPTGTTTGARARGALAAHASTASPFGSTRRSDSVAPVPFTVTCVGVPQRVTLIATHVGPLMLL